MIRILYSKYTNDVNTNNIHKKHIILVSDTCFKDTASVIVQSKLVSDDV